MWITTRIKRLDFMYLINRHRFKDGGIAMRTIGKVFEKPKKERKPVKTETEKQEQEKKEKG